MMYRERGLFLFFALILVNSFLGSTQCLAQVQIGSTEPVSISTPHPYPNGDPSQPVVWSQTITHAGATFIKVHFENMSIENNMPKGPFDAGEAFGKDYVSILDAYGNEVDRLTGVGDKWAISVPGDTAIIELHANRQNAWYGFDIDQYGWGFMAIGPESTCGEDGKTSICDASIGGRISLSDPVARLLFQSDCGGFYVCTGFLFDEDGCFMTNAHCANSPTEAASAEVWFNYQRSDCDLDGRNNPDVFKGLTHFQTECDLDLSVLQVSDPVKGNPASIYGQMTLSDRMPVFEEAIWMPQHSGGRRKEISEDGLVVTVPVGGFNFCADPPDCAISSPTGNNTEFGHQADTEGGSSGSPVLDTNNLVIGLHHAGGCSGTDSEQGRNQAVLMSAIIPQLVPCTKTTSSTTTTTTTVGTTTTTTPTTPTTSCDCTVGRCISGRVKDLADNPLTRKTVKLMKTRPRRPRVSMTVVTDENGCYSFTGSELVNGTYSIKVARCKGADSQTVEIAGDVKVNGVNFQCR